MYASSRRPAFGHYDLLPVIAILAILAAILYPVFSHARENVRQTYCLSNEKQIGMSVRLYMQDYDETQPRCQNDVTHTSWRNDVRPYLKHPQIFACLSNPNKDLLSRNSPETRNDDDAIHISYALNNNDANGVGGASARRSEVTPLARIPSPALVIGMVESTAYYSDFVVIACVEGDGGRFHSKDSTGKNGHLFTHHGRSNFWFMDGHCKSLKPLDTMNVVDPGSSKTPGSLRNLWTIDNSGFTDQDHSRSPDATPFTSAHENLRYSQSAD